VLASQPDRSPATPGGLLDQVPGHPLGGLSRPLHGRGRGSEMLQGEAPGLRLELELLRREPEVRLGARHASPYSMMRPPATSRVTPVSHEADSEARKSVAAATSSGTPIRPRGDIRATSARRSGLMIRSTRSERTVAGATQLTRMPCWPTSRATCRVSITIPALAAA